MGRSLSTARTLMVILAFVGVVLNIYLANQTERSAVAERPSTSWTLPVITSSDKSLPKTNLLTIDVISVGSNTRSHYPIAQLETFGSHPAVRHFFRLSELNDTEADCHRNLTEELVHTIRYRCGKKPKRKYRTLDYFNRLFASPQYLSRKGNVAGWLCAQKRPIDGLYRIFQKYYTSSEQLPDYLFLLDDDTYVHMPSVLDYFEGFTEDAYVFAGCLARVRWMNFSFPYGGWGTFFSRSSLQRWREPIDCSQSMPTEWVGFACQRLSENSIGERRLFQDGMTLMELMYRYAKAQPYLDFDHWDDVGFCLHSDTALAYFVNFYRIAAHATQTPGGGHPRGKVMFYEEDRLLGYNGSLKFAGRQLWGSRKQKKECLHWNDTLCTTDAHLCHYVTPKRMRELYKLHP